MIINSINSIIIAFFLVFFNQTVSINAQTEKEKIINSIDNNSKNYCQIAKQIWNYAELGYIEEKSSKSLQVELKKEGFNVETGVAGIPTAFVASFGSGKPVIALIAEFDALPGMSQDTIPIKKAMLKDGNGHGCGHNLFGTASVAAAISIKDHLKTSGISGTIKVYGTPAEEGGAGKAYMVREGLFKDVDIVLHWHPADMNEAVLASTFAVRSAKFRFHGISSHASLAPEFGRSALDGVEAMNYMVNLIREHIPDYSRIHYVITKGGNVPNVVPDFSEVYYYMRHPDIKELEKIWEKILNAAEGAAKGTGTSFDYDIIHGAYGLLPNEALIKIIDSNLKIVGGVKYNDQEKEFAQKIMDSYEEPTDLADQQEEIVPYQYRLRKASSDVGDVSWNVPTGGFVTATFVPGTKLHSWQAVATGGMSIGMKGMIMAAKTLALTAYDLYAEPSKIEIVKDEFYQRRGKEFVYKPLIGDKDPPLDYRKY